MQKYKEIEKSWGEREGGKKRGRGGGNEGERASWKEKLAFPVHLNLMTWLYLSKQINRCLGKEVWLTKLCLIHSVQKVTGNICLKHVQLFVLREIIFFSLQLVIFCHLDFLLVRKVRVLLLTFKDHMPVNIDAFLQRTTQQWTLRNLTFYIYFSCACNVWLSACLCACDCVSGGSETEHECTCGWKPKIRAGYCLLFLCTIDFETGSSLGLRFTSGL